MPNGCIRSPSRRVHPQRYADRKLDDFLPAIGHPLQSIWRRCSKRCSDYFPTSRKLNPTRHRQTNCCRRPAFAVHLVAASLLCGRRDLIVRYLQAHGARQFLPVRLSAFLGDAPANSIGRNGKSRLSRTARTAWRNSRRRSPSGNARHADRFRTTYSSACSNTICCQVTVSMACSSSNSPKSHLPSPSTARVSSDCTFPTTAAVHGESIAQIDYILVGFIKHWRQGIVTAIRVDGRSGNAEQWSQQL